MNLKISSCKIIWDSKNNNKKCYFRDNYNNEFQPILPQDNAFYIRCGIVNNITVIDIDNSNKSHNKELIVLIEKTGPTLVEKTRKGFHYYFKYVDKLPSKINSKLELDILNDNRICFCAPTSYKIDAKTAFTYELLNELPIS